MVDYIVCRMREVVVPIYPDACGVDVTGHKALDGTGHQELAIRVWLRSGQIFTHVKIWGIYYYYSHFTDDETEEQKS